METEDSYHINQCLKGNVEAFSSLVKKYQNAVYGLALSYVKNFDVAQDIAQEAFIKTYLRLSSLREHSRFCQWLKSIVANLSRNWLRKQSLKIVSIDEIDENQGVLFAKSTQSPSEINESKEIKLCVMEAIDKLSEKNRQTVILYYIDGLSSQEIGNFLEVSAATIDQRLHRAREQLKKEMIEMVEKTFTENKLGTKFVEKIKKIITKVPIEDLQITVDKLPWYEQKFQKALIRGEIPEDWSPERTRLQIDLVEKCLSLKPGSMILDLGCCFGRHSVELAKRGFEVVGIDLGEEFIKQGRVLAKQESVSVKFIQQDILKIVFKEQFDAVIVLGNSLTMFEDKDIAKLLKLISKALKPAGKLFCEIENRDYQRRYENKWDREQMWQVVSHQTHKDIFLHEYHFDPISGRSWARDYSICPQTGMIDEYISCSRMFTFTEFKLWLGKAGLKSEKVFGDDWKGEKLSTNSTMMLVVAKKS